MESLNIPKILWEDGIEVFGKFETIKIIDSEHFPSKMNTLSALKIHSQLRQSVLDCSKNKQFPFHASLPLEGNRNHLGCNVNIEALILQDFTYLYADFRRSAAISEKLIQLLN